MNRQYYYGLLFVLGASLLLSLAYCPPFDLLLDDKEIFKYAGMSILRGNVPYRDFFDHKPPMIFFINAAGLALGPWGLWMINTALALVTTFLFFNLCRTYRLAFPWLLPFLFNLLIRDNLISLGINMTREYTAFFTVIFFCILLGKYRYKYFWLGFFSALVFFTQQDQALPLVPFLLYATLNKGFWGHISRLAAGILSFTIPLLIYFAIHRSLSHFWADAFQFNLSVYTTQEKSLWEHFRTIKSVLDDGNYEIPFMLALILGVCSLFLQNKRKSLVIASLVSLFLTLSPELMGGRLLIHGVSNFFIYYFLPLSAAICITLFTVFAFTEDKVLADGRSQLPYALLLCCSLLYTAFQHITHLQRRDADPVLNTPELAWLRHKRPGDYQLYVFYNNPYICFYNELKILAPSRWIYQHFWGIYANWDSDHGKLRTIGQDLLLHRTTYVIMDAATIDQFADPASRDWWLSFMAAHYEPVLLPGERHPLLWQLKDTLDGQ
jgi:hypothetical protein